tara:strand:- start:157 stop:663 length:507 start_codon:yes stop_codon:yes gene_type:complete
MVVIYFILSLFSIEQENRYIINNSKIEFYSYAPLEDIQAVNTESVGAIDIESGEFIIKIPVNAFEFPNKLMQKHFNDSYLETDIYPECIFRGKINENSASGEITLHGVTKKIEIPISKTINEENIIISTDFKILLKDHKIKIPRLLFQNIAEEIEIKVSSEFIKYKQE